MPPILRAPIARLLIGGLMLAVIGGGAIASGAAAQDQASARRKHMDVLLAALPPKEGADYDVKPIDPSAALDRMAAALDLVYGSIAFGKARIETLKRSGLVMLAYDPNYPDPKSSMGTIRVAAFLPHYLPEVGQGSGKNFVVIVSRHGIKWPTRELAAVLVHELVGHGMQHLEGRLEKMRNVDLECESWLYEELAYQKLGFDKSSREMIKFRQELEGVGFVDGYCSDFKRYMQKHAAASMGLWEALNPDVPGLLAVFPGYVADLVDKGVTRGTQQAAEKYAAAEMGRIFKEGSAEEQFQIARLLLSGVSMRPDHVQAARWMARSAEQGHAAAQYALGVMYGKGQGVEPDHSTAATWYRKAAEQGAVIAQFKLGTLYDIGRGVPQDASEAAKWYRKAAENGYALGQYNLGVLYDEGRGVSRNDAEAADWYGKAAAQGHAEAQMRTANFYLQGTGVARDLAESLFWLTVIVERQEGRIREKASYLRSRLAKRLSPEQISEVEARVRAWQAQTGAVGEAKGK